MARLSNSFKLFKKEKIDRILGKPCANDFYFGFLGAVNLFEIKKKEEFLAQVCYESNYFKSRVENLSYSTKAILKVFGKYVNNNENIAKKYACKPKKLAMLVYDRPSLGNRPGTYDAWDYRGRGYIQVTGRKNYKQLEEDIQQPYLKKPDLVASLPHCWYSAGHYWVRHNIDDIKSFKHITKAINGGYNGYEKRLQILKIIQKNH